MVKAFHVFTLLMIAVAMALSLAHALELPGKLRLSKDTYLAVQQIYYPGFTYGGFSEIGSIFALAILICLLPLSSAGFWWVTASLVLFSMSHMTYWVFTHPVNGFWLEDVELTGLGGVFFEAFGSATAADWTKLRDVWEYSHVVRACLSMLSFVAAAIALAL
ncbi:MAG: DUF1772 domain-containing protein [Pseudomonadota bacterium]|nr:DUF1772 domain-containing protein [Pseudomonadota bacterium]